MSQLYDDVEHKSQAERVTAYEHAMRDLVARQPADTEAKIFYAIALVARRHRRTKRTRAN